MADLCLPLSAGEDAFELHSVQLELEAVERQINELLERQAQLRERQTALETSRADAHKSEVSIERAANTPTTSIPCVSLHRPRAPRTRSADTRDPEGRRERRSGRAARGRERHQAAADGDTEEGLQEPYRDGTQHIARDDDHLVRTASHVSTRTQKVQ